MFRRGGGREANFAVRTTYLKKLALASVALLGAAGLADAKDVFVTANEHLSSLITAAEKETLTELVVTTGTVDKTNPSAGLTAEDMSFLISMPKLKFLDLRDASISLDANRRSICRTTFRTWVSGA